MWAEPKACCRSLGLLFSSSPQLAEFDIFLATSTLCHSLYSKISLNLRWLVHSQLSMPRKAVLGMARHSDAVPTMNAPFLCQVVLGKLHFSPLIHYSCPIGTVVILRKRVHDFSTWDLCFTIPTNRLSECCIFSLLSVCLLAARIVFKSG